MSVFSINEPVAIDLAKQVLELTKVVMNNVRDIEVLAKAVLDCQDVIQRQQKQIETLKVRTERKG